jgi:hypothetical protein
MNASMPKLLAVAGGVLIAASGLVSVWRGLRSGALFYEKDPGGLFGHVGVVAGLVALAIGAALIWLGRQDHRGLRRLIAAGILMIVLGHLGAIAGALLVGTAGVILCYIAGIWLLARGVAHWRKGRPAP